MHSSYKDSALSVGQPLKTQVYETTDRLNTRTETQISEIHDIFSDISAVISQLGSILEPITIPILTENSVGPVPVKPTTTLIYDKLDALKDRGISVLESLQNLRRSIDL